jgi:hypothetical protein
MEAMQYLAALYDNESTVIEPGTPEWDASMPAYATFGEKHGPAIRGGEALFPSKAGFAVRRTAPLVTDGPFAETTEVIGGYYVFEADSLDDVMEIVRDLPVLDDPTGSVEVRPLVMSWEPEAPVEPRPGDVRYMAVIHGPEGPADIPDTPEWDAGAAEHGEFVEKHAGALLSGAAVKPQATATTVRKQDGEVQVTDGPAPDAAPIVGGLYVLRAQSRDEAVAVAQDIPVSGPESWVEVRPLVEFDEG